MLYIRLTSYTFKWVCVCLCGKFDERLPRECGILKVKTSAGGFNEQKIIKGIFRQHKRKKYGAYNFK